MGIKVTGGRGSGGGGGALAVPSDLVFANATARDTFFTANPARKVTGTDVVVNGVLQRWDGATFKDMTAVVRGPQGDPSSNLVQSVAGKTGVVVVTKADVGLNNVDNTSDLNKPISTAVQNALADKANTSHVHNMSDIFNLEPSIDDLTTEVNTLKTGKQDKLTSGTNIKTVNGNSLLGSGDVTINAVPDSTQAVTGGIRLTGDLGGSATSPKVEKINGVAVDTSSAASGKVLKATGTSAASFQAITAADVGAIPTSDRAVANGVADLDANGKLPSARLPAGIVQTVNGLTGDVTITKTMLGLGSVNNTADADKPISTATQTALNLKADAALLGAVNGIATLDSNGVIPSSQIGSITTGDTFVVANQAARLATNAKKGDVAVQEDTNESWILKTTPATLTANWVKLLFPASVTSVNGNTGSVTLTKSDLSLSNVDNTSDLNKPVSTATTTELNKKVDKTVLTAKGDLLSHDGTSLAVRTVGTDGQVLKADSTSPTGLKWENLPTTATINNTLTSTATDQPLSAAQGKVLKDLVDTRATGLVQTGGVLSLVKATGVDIQFPRATTMADGVMSSTDKVKLDGLTNVTMATANPLALGTAAVGTSTKAAREDHVHPAIADVSVATTVNYTLQVGMGVGATIINVTPAPTGLSAGMAVAGTGLDPSTTVVSVAGNNITITPASISTASIGSTVTVTTSVAKSGLMTSADKTKLNGIATGATNTIIVDNLTSTSATSALSANQGKVLQDGKAPLASPTFTGTPAAPTAAVDTNTTQLATTAFVLAQAANTAPSNGAATAVIGTSNRYARQDHVHRYPNGLHNGSRQVGTFSGTQSKIESPTASKSWIDIQDTSAYLNVNNLSRLSADGNWTVIRGPSGTDPLSHKIHMSDAETVIHAKNGKGRIMVYEGQTLLRSPAATNSGGSYFNLEDTFLTAFCQDKFRFGADATNTWGHSPNEDWRYWLSDTGFIVWKGGAGYGDMMRVQAATSAVRNSWTGISSDQRLKTSLRELSNEFLDAWGKHVKWGAYNWLEKDPQKADQKIQVGVMAQSIIAAFEEAELDWKEWRVVEYFEKEDRYGVCYDHCNAIENAYQRKRLDRLEALLATK